jgi:Xaa-Pro aminopeptidase
MNARFFRRNRVELQKLVSSGVIVLAGHRSMQRTNDASFSFEQESNFWYLTGIESPNWLLVIEAKKSWLVAPDIEEVHRIFDGSLSPMSAKRISGVDEVLTYAEGQSLLEKLAQNHKTVATIGLDPRAKHYDFTQNPAQTTLHRKLKKSFQSVEDCRLPLSKLRAIKQPEEIAAMRSVINLTVEAFKDIKSKLESYEYEYEVEADFSHFFRSRGAKGHAYDPIVASGKNACTLHYIDNNSLLKKTDLLLLDVGAKLNGYPADITRTYSLGSPSKRQQAVHRAVESAHREIIQLLKPGLSVIAYQEKVDEIMKGRLSELGLLKEPEDYRKYFPHAISHGLGIDVHDSLGRPETFEVGMVLTVEPGIYIPKEGIGVRIEDDILITKTGHENLSSGLPTSL